SIVGAAAPVAMAVRDGRKGAARTEAPERREAEAERRTRRLRQFCRARNWRLNAKGKIVADVGFWAATAAIGRNAMQPEAGVHKESDTRRRGRFGSSETLGSCEARRASASISAEPAIRDRRPTGTTTSSGTRSVWTTPNADIVTRAKPPDHGGAAAMMWAEARWRGHVLVDWKRRSPVAITPEATH
ncbi:MAG: hypothetical protein FD139_3679, partial [Methylocystaceae bacterium]